MRFGPLGRIFGRQGRELLAYKAHQCPDDDVICFHQQVIGKSGGYQGRQYPIDEVSDLLMGLTRNLLQRPMLAAAMVQAMTAIYFASTIAEVGNTEEPT